MVKAVIMIKIIFNIILYSIYKNNIHVCVCNIVKHHRKYKIQLTENEQNGQVHLTLPTMDEKEDAYTQNSLQ